MVSSTERLYGYIPNLGANAFGVAAFILLTLVCLIYGIYYRQWWFVTSWTIGYVLQDIGYIGRVVSSVEDSNVTTYQMQMAVLTLSPAFFMAGIYYQLAKLVTIYGEQFSLLSPMSYSSIFIVCDVVAILVQAAGGGIAASGSGQNRSQSRIDNGSYIMVAGLAFQVLTMLIFMMIFGLFIWRIWKAPQGSYKPEWAHVRQRFGFRFFIPALAWAVLLIWIRSIYRVVELSDGWRGHILRTERYQLVCDGLMVLLACIILTVVNPGTCLGQAPIPVRGIHYKKEQPFVTGNESYTKLEDQTVERC